MRKILLHSCCGPCATHVAKELSRDYIVVMYFYNPSIFPAEEYRKRLAELEKVAEIEGIELIKAEYDHDSWLRLVQGLEDEPEGGRRCDVCIRDRLKKTAEFAEENRFDIITTTLTISPHKDAKMINEYGSTLRIGFLESDFKKNNGFLKSVRFCKEHGIYRQNYCGCEFSLPDKQGRITK